MTPRARRIVEKRKQRGDAVFMRNEKARLEELQCELRPIWHPPTQERDYQRSEDLSQINPGENHD